MALHVNLDACFVNRSALRQRLRLEFIAGAARRAFAIRRSRVMQ
jgi:hypothetical protein